MFVTSQELLICWTVWASLITSINASTESYTVVNEFIIHNKMIILWSDELYYFQHNYSFLIRIFADPVAVKYLHDDICMIGIPTLV